MFFDQLKKICEAKNTTPTAVVRKLGLSSSKVTAWKNGTAPKMEVIEKLAKELDVPVSVFFGDDLTKASEQTLPEDALELIEVYQRLSKSGKRQLLGKAYELLDSLPETRTGEKQEETNTNMAVAVIDSRVKK